MELAATVCELLGWKRRTVAESAASAGSSLEKLQSQGGLVLPAKRPGRPGGQSDRGAGERKNLLWKKPRVPIKQGRREIGLDPC